VPWQIWGARSWADQLDLRDQGRFVLGFHHQRAHDRLQIQEYKTKTAVENGGSEQEIE
jgi:hypothetical protein